MYLPTNLENVPILHLSFTSASSLVDLHLEVLLKIIWLIILHPRSQKKVLGSQVWSCQNYLLKVYLLLMEFNSVKVILSLAIALKWTSSFSITLAIIQLVSG